MNSFFTQYIRFAVWMIFPILCGCMQMNSSGPQGPALKEQNAQKQRVTAAVSYIYEAATGNITELGNRYRDRIERDFKEQGYQVKARRDMVILLEDAESFGSGTEESEIWERAGVDVVVCGSYTVNRGTDSEEKAVATVNVKAYRKQTADLVEAYKIEETLEPGWVRLAAKVHGNVHKKNFETIVGTGGGSAPDLEAELDRDPACYPPGTAARISVKSEEGAHIYIFNIAADNTVSLLYPNQLMPNQPIASRRFVFPPESLSGLVRLVLYPLRPNESCREAFKVVASGDAMDFSFLPVSMNRIYL